MTRLLAVLALVPVLIYIGSRFYCHWVAQEEAREPSVLVSSKWLKEQQRKEQRIEFHSAPFAWPIDKRRNELSWSNREKLRKRA